MKFSIVHSTAYNYSQPVLLESHCVKLCPRSDGAQQLKSFNLDVVPSPAQITNLLDPDGNVCQRIWFEKHPVTSLKFVTQTVVETTRTNPFDYLTAPWALTAPIDYPGSLAARLSPYLQPSQPGQIIHPKVIEFAHDRLHRVDQNVGYFLTHLTQTIYEQCHYLQRLEGAPQPAALTLSQQSGTCRDFALLWVEACRAVGLAARFVSGYQKGDPDQPQHELHAWAEVYVPGGGWRGFDPTLGLAITDDHVTVATAAEPRFAAPVIGQIQVVDRVVKPQLECDIKLSCTDVTDDLPD